MSISEDSGEMVPSRSSSKVVMQRTATPLSSVRFRSRPPFSVFYFIIFVLSFTVFPEGSSTLMDAAEVSDPILLSRAIAEGEDINQRDDFGSTALIKAVLGGNHGMVDLLLQSGAKVEIQDMGGASALHIAARLGNTKIVEKLLSSLDTLPKPDIEGNTPYTRALKHGHTEIAKMISDKVEEILKRESLKESVKEEEQEQIEDVEEGGEVSPEVSEDIEEKIQERKLVDTEGSIVEEVRDTIQEIEQEEVLEEGNEAEEDAVTEEGGEDSISDIPLLDKKVEKQIMEVIEMTEGERRFEENILEENEALEQEVVDVIKMTEEEKSFERGEIGEREEVEEVNMATWGRDKYIQISNIEDRITEFISKLDGSVLNIDNLQVDYFTDDYGTAIRLYGLHKKEEAEQVCEILAKVKEDAICKLEQ